MSHAQRDMSPRRLYQIAMESSDLIAALPRRIDQITARLANSDLSTHLDAPQLSSFLVALQKVANHIFFRACARRSSRRNVYTDAILASYWPDRFCYTCYSRDLHPFHHPSRVTARTAGSGVSRCPSEIRRSREGGNAFGHCEHGSPTCAGMTNASQSTVSGWTLVQNGRHGATQVTRRNVTAWQFADPLHAHRGIVPPACVAARPSRRVRQLHTCEHGLV
jgi:hypothetical protein